MKLGRTYKLSIFSDPKQQVPDLVISYPLTIKFRVASNNLQSANTAHFMIYNLSESSRSSLYRDTFDMASSYRAVLFTAGYESEPMLTSVFMGDIYSAFSYRQGPDWITEIDCQTGGMAMEHAQVKLATNTGYSLDWLLRTMIKTMAPFNIGLGAIGDFTSASSNTSDQYGKPTRGIAISGATWAEIVRIMTPYHAECFIDKNLVYILNQGDFLGDRVSPIKELSSATGLIGTPRRADTSLIATMVFEPRVEVGQLINIKSDEPSVKLALERHGDFKIFDVTHTGTISGAVGGDALTMITMQLVFSPTPLPAVLVA